MQDNGNETDPNVLVKDDVEHVWHHLFQHSTIAVKEPTIMVEGDGLRLRDIRGREYLDATSGGVWCVNVGYGRKSIAEAVCAQMIKMPYYAATAGNIPYAQFAAKLTSLMPGISRVYLSNSGSEANEKAYKMVRAIGHMKHGGKKKTVLYPTATTTAPPLARSPPPVSRSARNGSAPLFQALPRFPTPAATAAPLARPIPAVTSTAPAPWRP